MGRKPSFLLHGCLPRFSLSLFSGLAKVATPGREALQSLAPAPELDGIAVEERHLVRHENPMGPDPCRYPDRASDDLGCDGVCSMAAGVSGRAWIAMVHGARLVLLSAAGLLLVMVFL